MLPQGVFGVALLTIIPFVIFALFLEFGLTGTSQRVLRKIGWVVYGVTFVVLWYKQTNVIGAKVGIITIGNIYLFSVIAAVAMFLFDGTIQNAFKKSKARTQREAHAEMHLGDLIKRQKEAYSKSIDPDLTEGARSAHEGEYEKLVKLVKKARKNL